MSAQFFYIFISKMPVWVFPIFFGLLFVGLQARKSRAVPVQVFWFLPLIGLVALPGVIALGQAEAYAVFVMAFLLGAMFGRGFQHKIVQGFEGNKVRVRGEWLTLTAMMVLFLVNFVKGAAVGIVPELAQSLLFILPVVGVTAFCSGTFLGRSLAVIGFSLSAERQTANQ